MVERESGVAAGLFLAGTLIAASAAASGSLEGCAAREKVDSQNRFFDNPVLLEGYYDCHEVERNEKVYYNHTSMQEPFILEVGAVPGDELGFEGCRLQINGSALKTNSGEPYCLQGKRKKLLELYEGEIDGYLLMADRPSGGYDSSRFGLVTSNSFEGRVKERSGLF